MTTRCARRGRRETQDGEAAGRNGKQKNGSGGERISRCGDVRTAWHALYLPLLRRVSLKQLADESGIAESLLHRYRKREVRRSTKQMKELIIALRSYVV